MRRFACRDCGACSVKERLIVTVPAHLWANWLTCFAETEDARTKARTSWSLNRSPQLCRSHMHQHIGSIMSCDGTTQTQVQQKIKAGHTALSEPLNLETCCIVHAALVEVGIARVWAFLHSPSPAKADCFKSTILEGKLVSLVRRKLSAQQTA